MGRESEETNLRELAEQIRAMGLPESVVEDLRLKAEKNKIGDLKLNFSTRVGAAPVKGSLLLERESPSGLLTAEYLWIDLSENPAAKHRGQFFDPNAPEKVTLREAVNLMEGRAVFRPNPADATKGYWVSLDPTAIYRPAQEPQILASSFKPEKAIENSPLAGWLNSAAQIVLGAELRWGERVQVEIGKAGQERTIYVEADVRGARLRVTDGNRKELAWPELKMSVGLEAGIRHGRGR